VIWSSINEQCRIRSCILDYTGSVSHGKIGGLQEMNCWHCNTELIWGSDFSGEDYHCEDEYSIVTNLSCPKCESFVQVFYPNKDE